MMASWKAYLLYVFVFVSINWCSIALGHFASCVSSNILVGLSVCTSYADTRDTCPPPPIHSYRPDFPALTACPVPPLCPLTVPAMSTPMILFSGLLYQRGTVPSWLAWIESVSIVNYGFSAMLIQQVLPILLDPSSFRRRVAARVADCGSVRRA